MILIRWGDSSVTKYRRVSTTPSSKTASSSTRQTSPLTGMGVRRARQRRAKRPQSHPGHSETSAVPVHDAPKKCGRTGMTLLQRSPRVACSTRTRSGRRGDERDFEWGLERLLDGLEAGRG